MPSKNRNTKPASTDAKAKDKPSFPRFLFWDFRFDDIEWREEYETVITRVLDRGNEEDLDELILFYGRDLVLQVLIHGEIYLMDHQIERACTYFGLEKEDLRCYHRKRERGGYWI